MKKEKQQFVGKGLCLTLNDEEVIVISDGTDSIVLEYYKAGGSSSRLRIVANPKYVIERVSKIKTLMFEGEVLVKA